MRQRIGKQLAQTARTRAGFLCEYCQLPEELSGLSHVLDHIIAHQHGGATILDNLALCCGRCNLSKGPNLSGLDPKTGRLTRLFHPRRDSWSMHFRWKGPQLIGVTAIGRTTIAVLAINHPFRVTSVSECSWQRENSHTPETRDSSPEASRSASIDVLNAVNPS